MKNIPDEKLNSIPNGSTHYGGINWGDTFVKLSKDGKSVLSWASGLWLPSSYEVWHLNMNMYFIPITQK